MGREGTPIQTPSGGRGDIMLIILALLFAPTLIAGLSRGTPRRVWEDTTWNRKRQRPSNTPEPRSGGRSRAAKRTALYDTLRSYSDHFAPLVSAEWQAEQDAITRAIEEWPRERLVSEGLLLRRLQARRLNRDFYGEPIIQLSLRSPAGPKGAAAQLPFHRFSVGDVVTLCAGDEPFLPPSLAGAPSGARDVQAASEGVVLQHTSTQLLVVTRSPPNALMASASARRGTPGEDGSGGAGGGTPASGRLYPFCLSLGASAVPYERCQAALDTLTEPEIREQVLCPELRLLITSSSLKQKSTRKGANTDAPSSAIASGGADLAARASEPPSFLTGGRGAAKVAVKAALKDGPIAELVGRMNPAQAEVVRTALRQRLTLVQGPPGTGPLGRNHTRERLAPRRHLAAGLLQRVAEQCVALIACGYATPSNPLPNRHLSPYDAGVPGKTRTACALLAGCVALHSKLAPGKLDGAARAKGGSRRGQTRGGAAGGGNSRGAIGSVGGGGARAAGGPILAVASSNVAADELLAGLACTLGLELRPETLRLILVLTSDRSQVTALTSDRSQVTARALVWTAHTQCARGAGGPAGERARVAATCDNRRAPRARGGGAACAKQPQSCARPGQRRRCRECVRRHAPDGDCRCTPRDQRR